MNSEDIIIDTSNLYWSVDFDQEYKEEFDDKGNLWLNSYYRKREIHFSTGEKKPWSEWQRCGVSIKIGGTLDTPFFEKIDTWFKTGEWKSNKIVRYIA
jgi:hypothetical protein